MKTIRRINFIVLQSVIAALLASCGGGNNDKNALTLRNSGNPGSIVTSNEPTVDMVVPTSGISVKTVTTTESLNSPSVDILTIDKTFKANVHLLIESSNISKVSDTEFRLKTLPSNFSIGSVFTFQDAAWKVNQISVQPNGEQVVLVRPADFDEVLSDLKVDGTFTMSNIDISRMMTVSDSDVTALESTDVTFPRLDTKAHSTTKALINILPPKDSGISCTLTNDAKETYNGFKCGFKRRLDKNDLVDLSIDFKGDLAFKDVKVSILSSIVNQDKGFEFTPSLSFGLDFGSNKNSGSAPAQFRFPFGLFKVIFPIQATLGFNRIEFPVAADIKGPGLSFGVSLTGDFPYKNGWVTPIGKLKILNGATDTTPTATLSAPDNFFGIKAGVSLVQTFRPIFKPDITFLFDTDKSVIASEGIFGKLGAKGDLSLTISPACFKWKGNPAGGGGAETKFRNPFKYSEFIEKSIEATVDGTPVFSGEIPDPCFPPPPVSGVGAAQINVAIKRTCRAPTLDDYFSLRATPHEGDALENLEYQVGFNNAPPNSQIVFGVKHEVRHPLSFLPPPLTTYQCISHDSAETSRPLSGESVTGQIVNNHISNPPGSVFVDISSPIETLTGYIFENGSCKDILTDAHTLNPTFPSLATATTRDTQICP